MTGLLVDISPFCPYVKETRVCPQRASYVKDCLHCQFTNAEIEKWQKMMFSCRKACHILGEEFQEPDFLNWKLGSMYHQALWRKIFTDSRR